MSEIDELIKLKKLLVIVVSNCTCEVEKTLHEDLQKEINKIFWDVAEYKFKRKIQEKKMNLKDKMKTLTKEASRTKEEKEEIERKKATIAARESGEKAAKRTIEKLPKRIKEAAERGESRISNSCLAGSEYGGFMLGDVAQWAREQGFKVEFKYNREPANEGGDPWNSLTISWE